MNQTRACGCKGKRSCLLCETSYDIKPTSFISFHEKENGYVYCYLCQKAWPGWDSDPAEVCPNHLGKSLKIYGIFVLPEFLTHEEQSTLLKGINMQSWDLSQSGRRKQNYGPKCNFKKNKIQAGNFNGFPSYSKFVHDKMKKLPILKNYITVEQCSLEYDPQRGASIDPHIDDCWIWGERIVTVNVLGNTFLTLTKFNGDLNKYNLHHVGTYPSVLDERGILLEDFNKAPFVIMDKSKNSEDCKTIFRIYMPERSLLILYGSARYEYEHFVLREDIKALRICLAFREFTPPYLPGGEKENITANILKFCNNFW